jgi:hypothetical protein
MKVGKSKIRSPTDRRNELKPGEEMVAVRCFERQEFRFAGPRWLESARCTVVTAIFLILVAWRSVLSSDESDRVPVSESWRVLVASASALNPAGLLVSGLGSEKNARDGELAFPMM